MEKLLEFISFILGVEYWPARWNCGIWTPFHGWTYIISSILIGSAYFAIPVVLYQFVRSRSDLPFVRIFWLFILFILACGSTHLIDAVIFWFPVYRLSALMLFLTALISWVAVLGLWRVLPQALALKSPAQLTSIIDARTRELEASNRALRKVNQDLDTFVYAASHDLKSPISNMEGLLRLIQEQIGEGKLPDPELVQRIQGCAARVQQSINSLTEVVKMQKSPYDDLEDLVFEELIREVQTENEQLFAQRQAQFHLDLEAAVLHYSRTGLKSILYNLIINAVKYTPAERRPEIRIRTRHQAGDLILEVSDNGCGIDLARHRDKLFRLFKRLNTQVEGSGIGLYFIKDLVERNGGSIGVESTPGEGSTFRIQFKQH
ncbi:MAG: HAMP domain-containing sensor histidine kinase [Bacteroidia bacterium]|nr:HAMP domain-containing sensor histidine kinase [Bacteroidia bacterium]